MAKQFNFNDSERGVIYQNSYVRLTRIIIDLDVPQAEFKFSVFGNQTARASGKRPVGWIEHSIKGQEFIAEYTAHLTQGKSLGAIAYEAASKAGLFPVDAIDV